MPDLSDPTALPEKPMRTRIEEVFVNHCVEEFSKEYGYGSFTTEQETIIDSITALYAAELDGLRAQIEEARSASSVSALHNHGLAVNHAVGCAKLEWGYDGLEDERDDIECDCYLSILAQSPRGTVAHIQAEALTAVDARIQRQMDAEEKKEPTPSSTGHWSGLAEAQQLLRTALREGVEQ